MATPSKLVVKIIEEFMDEVTIFQRENSFKVLVIGDSSVGKSQLISRMENKFSDEKSFEIARSERERREVELQKSKVLKAQSEFGRPRLFNKIRSELHDLFEGSDPPPPPPSEQQNSEKEKQVAKGVRNVTVLHNMIEFKTNLYFMEVDLKEFESYKEVCLGNLSGVVMVCDINSPETCRSCLRWKLEVLDRLKIFKNATTPCYLVINKGVGQALAGQLSGVPFQDSPFARTPYKKNIPYQLH
ncbi:hypothetical protein HELRODRAFT_175740 [Helobdella robusta]|uniref:Uncharacterized protein n=1 Tax=Helobdella robusta TaxID=6412 RepID=T1F9M0_HELRO|nr:hypothetical protein HELRODRAFT_175740 [Helobdella robusta]ESO00343.1 hypothetical protein HELRODRAFT_175740 [Helobdella robusta]